MIFLNMTFHVRNIAASQINNENYLIIIESYKAEVESGEFFGD